MEFLDKHPTSHVYHVNWIDACLQQQQLIMNETFELKKLDKIPSTLDESDLF